MSWFSKLVGKIGDDLHHYGNTIDRYAAKLFQANPGMFAALPEPVKKDVFDKARNAAAAGAHQVGQLLAAIGAEQSSLTTIGQQLTDLRNPALLAAIEQGRADIRAGATAQDTNRATYARYLR